MDKNIETEICNNINAWAATYQSGQITDTIKQALFEMAVSDIEPADARGFCLGRNLDIAAVEYLEAFFMYMEEVANNLGTAELNQKDPDKFDAFVQAIKQVCDEYLEQ